MLSDSRSSSASTGVEGLDHILRGGLPRGQLYLVQGEAGTGKTLLGLQFLRAGAEAGEQGLFISLSQREQDLRRSAAGAGLSLEGLHVHEFSRAEALDRAASRQVLFHTADVELGEATQELLDVVERVNPARVVFDGIGHLRMLADSPLRYRHQLLDLRDFFADRETTALLVDNVALSPGDGELESLTFGVIQLRQGPTDYGNERRFLRVMKLRGLAYHAGTHDFHIRTGGLEVYPRLETGSGSYASGWSLHTSGVEGLDALVGGGLAEGTSCLLVGPSGTGKTSVATLYALAAARRGERAAVFLFDELAATFRRRSEGLGMPVQAFEEQGLLSIDEVSTGMLSPGAFADLVRRAVTQRGVRVVVLDTLTGYMSAMPDERLLITQMHDLLSYLSRQGVLTLLVVAQHGVIGPAVEAPLDVSYLADAVLLLRHFEAEGTIRQALSVYKKRYGPHERQIRELHLEAGGLRVGEPLANLSGVLSGTLTFQGDREALINGDTGADVPRPRAV